MLTSLLPAHCQERFCLEILQVQRSKQPIPDGVKDREETKAQIKRAFRNPLQSPDLDVCHYFVYVLLQPGLHPKRADCVHPAVWTAYIT